MNNEPTVTITLSDSVTDNRPKLGDIGYGNPITGVPGGNDNVYFKMKKATSHHNWTQGSCLLYNTKYGTTREVPGKTRVTPCEGTMAFHPLPPERFKEALKY